MHPDLLTTSFVVGNRAGMVAMYFELEFLNW